MNGIYHRVIVIHNTVQLQLKYYATINSSSLAGMLFLFITLVKLQANLTTMAKQTPQYLCAAILLLTSTSCSRGSGDLNDHISKHFKPGRQYTYHYDGNKVTLDGKGFEAYMTRKAKGMSNAAREIRAEREPDTDSKSVFTKEQRAAIMKAYPETSATRSFNISPKESEVYYQGYIDAGGKTVSMEFAVTKEDNNIIIILEDDGLKTGYAFHKGYCTGFDRFRHTPMGAKGFMSEFMTNRWQHSMYVVEADKIIEASYAMYDNSTDPGTSEYKELYPGVSEEQELIEQAYFYLYLAEQIMGSESANCFAQDADVVGGLDSIRAFCARYIGPYLSEHHVSVYYERQGDQVAFSLEVDENGRARLLKPFIHFTCESYQNVSDCFPTIEATRTAIADSISTHLNELEFTRKERNCKGMRDTINANYEPGTDITHYRY